MCRCRDLTSLQRPLLRVSCRSGAGYLPHQRVGHSTKKPPDRAARADKEGGGAGQRSGQRARASPATIARQPPCCKGRKVFLTMRPPESCQYSVPQLRASAAMLLMLGSLPVASLLQHATSVLHPHGFCPWQANACEPEPPCRLV